MEGRSIKHISIQSGLIEPMGYEPQHALLEIRLSSNGKVWQYRDVPEDVWYQLREDHHPDAYFRRYVCGHYRESLLADECGSPCPEAQA